MDDVESLHLVRECRELEERYKVDYTSTILAAESEDRHSVVKTMVEVILKEDLALQMQSSSEL